MRCFLLLALLLYDIVAQGVKPTYDYDELEGKRNAYSEDRRNWRKKALLKQLDQEGDSNIVRGQRNYNPGGGGGGGGGAGVGSGKSGEYYESWQKKALLQQLDPERDRDIVRGQQNFNPGAGGGGPAKSGEFYDDKEQQQKPAVTMNCDRPHERYEPCFSGCAAVSCDNPRDRLRPCYPFCEPGCVCTPPFVRDDRTHKCVLPDECTKGLKGVPDIGEEV